MSRKSSLAPPHKNPGARNTVTIACKLPHGLIIRLHQIETYTEQGRNGELQHAKRAVEVTGTRVVIKGTNSLLSDEPRMPTSFAYALTHGVPKDIWDAWLAENRDADCVVNGLVFAAPTRDRAEAQAREQEGLLTGQEPIDRDAPQRHVSKIKRFDKRT